MNPKTNPRVFYSMVRLKAMRDGRGINYRLGQPNYHKTRTRLHIVLIDALKHIFDIPNADDLREMRIEFYTKLCGFDKASNRLNWGLDEEFTTTNQLPVMIAHELLDLEDNDPVSFTLLVANTLQ